MQRSRRSGQTLIEAIAALGILVIGFLGILALLARSFATVRTISNETTATYLSAEGIELAKSVLDHVMFGSTVLNSSQWWWPCFAVTPGAAVDYGFDYSLLFSQGSCSSLNGWQRQNQFLLFDPSTGLYSYTAGTATTGFKRDINISVPANNPNEVIVVSTVTWDGGASRVQLEDHFYNWFPPGSFSSSPPPPPPPPPPPTDTTPPTAPTALTASPLSSQQVGLSWAASTDPDNAASTLVYNVYDCQGSGCTPSTFVGTTAAGITKYTASGLSPSTLYGFAVSASDPAGNVSASKSNSAYATTQSGVVSCGTTLYAANFSGANAAAKIQACLNALTPGEVCVAQNLSGTSLPAITVPSNAHLIMKGNKLGFSGNGFWIGASSNIEIDGDNTIQITAAVYNGLIITTGSHILVRDLGMSNYNTANKLGNAGFFIAGPAQYVTFEHDVAEHGNGGGFRMGAGSSPLPSDLVVDNSTAAYTNGWSAEAINPEAVTVWITNNHIYKSEVTGFLAFSGITGTSIDNLYIVSNSIGDSSVGGSDASPGGSPAMELNPQNTSINNVVIQDNNVWDDQNPPTTEYMLILKNNNLGGTINNLRVLSNNLSNLVWNNPPVYNAMPAGTLTNYTFVAPTSTPPGTSTIAVSTKFALSDPVSATANLNAMSSPTAASPIVAAEPAGSAGTVIGGPISSGGSIWWNVAYNNCKTGWSMENYLGP